MSIITLARHLLSAAVILAAVLLPSPCPAAPEGPRGEPETIGNMNVAGNVVWKGDLRVAGTVTVPVGSTLTIEPGTALSFDPEEGRLQVNGTLIALGTEERPIRFSGGGGSGGLWSGLQVNGAEGESRLSHCTVEGAKTALSLGSSKVRIGECVFEGNGTAISVTTESALHMEGSVLRGNERGIDVGTKARLTVEGSSFSAQKMYSLSFATGSGGRVSRSTFDGADGIVVRQAADLFIHGNAFRDTRVGIRLDQVGPKVRLSGNTFRGGKAGVLAMNFSRPWIACCEFTALEDGLVATRFSRPLVTNCLFEKNGRGLFAHQKSNFPIRKNLFRGNEKAVFVDLSSYPTIEMNNFEGNGRDIALGIYMSADWEGRVGSGDFSRRRAGSKNSPNLPGIGRSTEFPGEVDARNNWWGERTAREMEEKGEGGNIEAFDDYHDRNEVSYPDWGEGSYRLDRVKYRPWAKEAFPGAGPVPGGCGDFSAEGEEQDR